MKTRTCFQKLIDINKILESDLSNSEKLVLIKMSMYNDCYITNKQLSTSLKIPISSIERAIASLKKKKIMEVTRTTKANSKMQQRKVAEIDFDGLNNNTAELQEKNQTLISDGLIKDDVSEEQTLTSGGLISSITGDEQAQPRQPLHFSEQTLTSGGLINHEKPPTNSVTMPRVKLLEQTLTSGGVYNNNIINNKTIRYIIDTPTQKIQKRSEFSVNKSTNTTKKKKRFKKPTVEEIRQYCIERGNTIDPEYFYDWYASRDWFLSKGTHMVDWKASVRTWEYKAKKWKEEEEEKRKKKEIARLPTGQAQQKYTQSWYDKDAELRKQAVMAATGDNHDK